jgi:hypothetical protein
MNRKNLLQIILTSYLLLISSANSMQHEIFYVYNCNSAETRISSKLYPLGIPFSRAEVCYCDRKHWRGSECDIKQRYDRLVDNIILRNNLIADRVLEDIKVIQSEIK